MKDKVLTVLLCMFVLLACDKDDADNKPVNCEDKAIISADLYVSAPDDDLIINSLEIVKDCLKINFSSSGCSGDSWELKLIDSGDILESFPPQRNLRLSLKNDEACDAYITKELTFDISSLRVDGDRVKFNLKNFEEGIMYRY